MALSQEQLIDHVSASLAELAAESGRPPPADRVIAALRRVPRAAFVPPDLADLAHLDEPLPIGFEQTISQPFIVALMTDLLQLQGDEKVLEIGTGSGYQAAILGELATQVFSVERVAPLAEAARHRLRRLGYGNVRVRADNGKRGWPEAAPFDAIIVTAAALEVPPALLAQLAPGGRLVLPLELRDGEQELTVVHNGEDGRLHRDSILPVRFVPLLPGEWQSGLRNAAQA
jgi:protein-L-isoaspartate(D-aspartate) O-methyltransferase